MPNKWCELNVISICTVKLVDLLLFLKSIYGPAVRRRGEITFRNTNQNHARGPFPWLTWRRSAEASLKLKKEGDRVTSGIPLADSCEIPRSTKDISPLASNHECYTCGMSVPAWGVPSGLTILHFRCRACFRVWSPVVFGPQRVTKKKCHNSYGLITNIVTFGIGIAP